MRVLVCGLVGTVQEIRDSLTFAFMGIWQVDRARLSDHLEGRKVQIRHL